MKVIQFLSLKDFLEEADRCHDTLKMLQDDGERKRAVFYWRWCELRYETSDEAEVKKLLASGFKLVKVYQTVDSF